MPTIDPATLAQELAVARAGRQIVHTLPSAREPALDLATAYAVEAELVRMRQAAGRATVGRKVGFANKALWRVLKLDTLVWAHMYDDTVRHAKQNDTTLPLASFWSPKIEPELVFGMRRPLPDGTVDAATVLDAVEWFAIGFEIVACPYADWKFKPADFVAAGGFHEALILGTPRPVDRQTIPSLAERLAAFTVTLGRDGQAVVKGAGRNVLRSPALCLAELATALARQPGADPLGAGELVSSGSLTEPQFIGPGETWTAHVEGLELPNLTVRTLGSESES
jgi:2-oxo-3-hexenedioate decarboxylase